MGRELNSAPIFCVPNTKKWKEVAVPPENAGNCPSIVRIDCKRKCKKWENFR
jgi:hypothetical protein